MKIGIVTKIFLSLGAVFTGLIGVLYIIYLGLGSISPTPSNTQPTEQFISNDISVTDNSVNTTGNICAECGRECPTATELQLIDENMDTYYICGSSTCVESHNRKVTNKKSESEYRTGSDGRIYETAPCGLCDGSGVEEVRNSLGVERRVCPMCNGKGHKNY